MTFTERLKELFEALQDAEGPSYAMQARVNLETFLVDKSPALLKVVEAAQEIADKHHGSAQRAVEQSGLREALRDLDGASE